MLKRRMIVRGLLILLSLVLVPSCYNFLTQERTGTSPTREGAGVRGLPPDARNVEWFFPNALGPMDSHELDTSEVGFRQWVSEQTRPKLEGPKLGPYRCYRYNQSTKAIEERSIENAIAYDWREADRGVYLV